MITGQSVGPVCCFIFHFMNYPYKWADKSANCLELARWLDSTSIKTCTSGEVGCWVFAKKWTSWKSSNFISWAQGCTGDEAIYNICGRVLLYIVAQDCFKYWSTWVLGWDAAFPIV